MGALKVLLRPLAGHLLLIFVGCFAKPAVFSLPCGIPTAVLAHLAAGELLRFPEGIALALVTHCKLTLVVQMVLQDFLLKSLVTLGSQIDWL